MGTGKTLVALMFFRNANRNYRRVIITRPTLVGVYDIIHRRMFRKPLPVDIEITTYDDLRVQLDKGIKTNTPTPLINGAIVVFDEAHWLLTSEVLDAPASGESSGIKIEGIRRYRLMSEPARVLLMTGTAGTESSPEYRTLVNIAAGKELIPQNNVVFAKEFMVVNLKDAAKWGYIANIFNSGFARRSITFFTDALAGLFIAAALTPTKIDELNVAVSNFVYKFAANVTRVYDDATMDLKWFVPEWVDGKYQRAKQKVVKLTEKRFVKLFVTYAETELVPDLNLGIHRIPTVENLKATGGAVAWGTTRAVKYMMFGLLAFMFKYLTRLQMKARNLMSNDERGMEFRDLNTEKYDSVTGPYISTFAMQDDPALAFPKIHRRKIINVDLTPYQFEVYNRIRFNVLRPMDIIALGFADEKTAEDFAKSVNLRYGAQREVASHISAVSNWKPRGSGGGGDEEVATPKFKRLSAEIKKDKTRPLRYVVYTSIKFIVKHLVEFLTREGTRDGYSVGALSSARIDAMPSMLTDFANGNIDILVLDPDMTEGLSVMRTRVFHILDTPDSVDQMRQLEARAVRFDSHISLPPKERVVEYQYYVSVVPKKFTAAMTGILNFIRSPSAIAEMLKSPSEVTATLRGTNIITKLWIESGAYETMIQSQFEDNNESIMWNPQITPDNSTAVCVKWFNKIDKTRERLKKKAAERGGQTASMPCCPRFVRPDDDALDDPYCVERQATKMCPKIPME